MPGRIQPGVTREVASTLDLFPTALALANTPLPAGVMLDGMDLSALLFASKPMPERAFFYYTGNQITACRIGEWKAHFHTQIGFGPPESRKKHDPPLLFHLGRDPSEKRSVTANHPDVLEKIRAAVAAHQAGVVTGKTQ
jgi:arylsulfatase A-like enzyme